MKKVTHIILLSLILILLCLTFTACSKTPNAVNQNILKKYTPVQIINLYIDSLKTGDYGTINKIMSKNFLKAVNDGKGYSSLPSLIINDVKIKLFDPTGLNPDISEKYQNIPSNVNYYELVYTVDEKSDATLFGSSGEFTYFVKLVLEDDIWKIDALSTSP